MARKLALPDAQEMLFEAQRRIASIAFRVRCKRLQEALDFILRPLFL